MKSNLSAIRRIIKQITTILNPEQKRKSIVVFISMILTSLLELISVSMIYPFLNFVLSPEKGRDTWYLKWLYLIVPDATTGLVVLILGLGIICSFILKNGFSLYFVYLQNKFAVGFQKDASTLMLSSYMKRPYEYFVNHNSAELLRGVNNDTVSVYNELLAIFQASGELLTISMISIYLFYTSWEIAIGALLLACFCFLFIVILFKGRIKRAGIENREASAEKNKYCLQAINGIKEITASCRREYFVNEYERAALKFSKNSLTYNFLNSCPSHLIEGICISGFVAIVCIRIAIDPYVVSFIPVMGAFAMGTFRLLPSISGLSNRINAMVYHQQGLQHFYKNITEVQALEYEKNAVSISSPGDAISYRFNRVLTIKGISWKYSNSDIKVLDDLSLQIYKGESIALIGPSGAGKTTLADVILGLYEPQTGSVEVDGINIFSISNCWSKIVGYVPQTVYLIDDTIRSNVAFGISKETISDDKVWNALRQAQMMDFIQSLPDGIDTIVGERGVKFSGGQRQRIAIARALYENPDILVLDEATSALDTETENAVMESIETLQGYKTLVIVAHRLTTIRNCDRIFEIIDGKAVERKKEEFLEAIK